jgi:hypothetical protein
MRQKQAFGHGRAISILVAAGVGYLIGSWNAAAVRSTEAAGSPTAAQTVALRFPRVMSDAPLIQATAYERPESSPATLMREDELALFEPVPMVSRPATPQPAVQTPVPQAAVQPTPEQTADLAPAAAASAPILPKPKQVMSAAKLHPALAHHQASRPGSALDDAQLASIKRRLQLTPDQERMWPAVAAALRNLADAKAREAGRLGEPGAIDPNSAEVQDFKSAAIPLLMSFSGEQRDEVRSIAHMMGLDQLASQF